MSKVTMQGFLALLITAGFIACIAMIVFAPPPNAEMRDTLLVLTGGLGAAFTAVVQFYFGSSKGSSDKDQTIKEALAK